MAQIPLGNFDQVQVQAPVRTGAPDLSGALAAGRAKQDLGQQLLSTAEHGMQIHQQREEQQRQEDEALARAKAANGLAQHELEVRAAAADVGEQIQTGAIDYNKAGEAFDAAVSKIKPVEITGLDPALTEHYQGGLRNNTLAGRLLIDGAVKQAKRDDFKSQFTTNLDTLGKIAGQPGADIAKINEQAKAFIPLGRSAGLDEATLTKAVQDFADRNWTNQATQRFNAAHDDPVQLQALEHDLADEKGVYADKLDADKRNAIAAQVGNRIDTLQAKAEHAADRADAIADRTFAQMDEQFATGIPATAEQWAHWSDLFKDSPRKAEFTQRVQDEREIQTFLRKPIDQQLTEIQNRETDLATKGGDLHAIANAKRLRSAVDANVKLLTEQPLVFAQARAGLAVKSLDLASLADPSRAGEFGAVLQQRAGTVAALQKQYGNQVKTNLLLPQEAQGLAAVLTKMPPETKVSTFAQLRQLAGSDSSYAAIMQQIARRRARGGTAHVLARRQHRQPERRADDAQGRAAAEQVEDGQGRGRQGLAVPDADRREAARRLRGQRRQRLRRASGSV
jgi:hypothetical protein